MTDLAKAFEPKEGWWTETIAGRPWFTDGQVMFEGEQQTSRPPLSKGSMAKVYKKITAARLTRLGRVRHGLTGYSTCEIATSTFANGPRIQRVYFDYAKSLGAEFFAGAQCGESKRDRYVICKAKGKIIGIIMPVRYTD